MFTLDYESLSLLLFKFKILKIIFIIQKNYNDECKWLNRNLNKEYNKGCNDKKNSDKFNDICQNIISENLKHKRYIIYINPSLSVFG